jgi:hypothetical protein
MSRENYYQGAMIGQYIRLCYDESYTGNYTVFTLRLQVGDETFSKSHLSRTLRYGNAGTDELIAVAEKSAGKKRRLRPG